MSADPFSDILSLTEAQSVYSGGFQAGGAWALSFPAPAKIKIFALVKGSCWLQVEDNDTPLLIEQGDVLLLSFQKPFLLAGDLEAKPIEAASVFSDTVRFVQIGEGDDCVQVGGHVKVNPTTGGMLTEILPPLVHIRADAPEAIPIQWLLQQMVQEENQKLPGSSLALSQIVQLVFLQILRVHLANSHSFPPGWLRAIGDERIAPALHLMHAEPDKAWQLNELARAAAMSRTTFAQHFKAVAGVPPLTYLANWRMHLAKKSLREEKLPLSTLALSLGYTSESAFSAAFKRMVGVAPQQFRAAARRNAETLNTT